MQWFNHGIFFKHKQEGFSAHAQLPVIDTSQAAHWRIYYSSRNNDNYSLPFYVDVEAGAPESILAKSGQAVLEVGEPGAFDQHGVMPTEIWHHKGQDYLYYIGWNQAGDKPFTNSIGLAIKSEQGVWEKHKQAVIKGFAGSYYAGTLGIFSQQAGKQKLWGYYLACTAWQHEGDNYDPCYQIAMAQSENGIDWQQEADIAIPFKSANEGGIVSARVLDHHDCFHMFYAYRGKKDFRSDANQSYRIGYAQSRDLKNWFRHDSLMDHFSQELRNGILGEEKTGCDFMQCYPYIVKHNDELFMFYNGNGFGQTGIAYATLPLNQLPNFIAQER